MNITAQRPACYQYWRQNLSRPQAVVGSAVTGAPARQTETPCPPARAATGHAAGRAGDAVEPRRGRCEPAPDDVRCRREAGGAFNQSSL